jgi:hypothetical protein
MDYLLIQIGVYSALILAVIEVAKRVAEVIPGKRDDEIVSAVDGIIRSVLDLLAGRNIGTPGDPGARKPDKD